MNNLVRSIRKMTETVSAQRGKPILVSACLSDNKPYLKSIGIDIDKWLEEGLIDVISVGCIYGNHQSWDATVEEYKNQNVPLYAVLDDLGFESGKGDADLAKEAAYAWNAGMDGIYTYNYFNPAATFFDKIGSLATCGPVDPSYATLLKVRVKPFSKYDDEFKIDSLNCKAYTGTPSAPAESQKPAEEQKPTEEVTPAAPTVTPSETLSVKGEQILDINSKLFKLETDWLVSGLKVPGSSGETTCYYTASKDKSAYWAFKTTAQKGVEILYYMPKTPNTTENGALPIDIIINGKTTTVKVDCRGGAAQWHSLGKYDFTEGGTVVIRVRSSAGVTSRLTSVKLSTNGSSSSSTTTTPSLDLSKEQILDINSKMFNLETDWDKSGLKVPGSSGEATSYFTVKAGKTASWGFKTTSKSGNEIFYYIPKTPNTNENKALAIDITIDGKTTTKKVDCSGTSARWFSLGKYNFTNGGTVVIRVKSDEKVNSRVTSVKIVPGK